MILPKKRTAVFDFGSEYSEHIEEGCLNSEGMKQLADEIERISNESFLPYKADYELEKIIKFLRT